MPATSFTGWSGDWPYHDWENTTVEIRRRPASGRAFTSYASGVLCKADGERNSLVTSGAGVMDARTRRFFFPVTYLKSGEAARDIRTYLRQGDALRTADNREWTVMLISEPGDADQHIEVQTQLGVPE